jgi:methylase of polypeptide subunit release factors
MNSVHGAKMQHGRAVTENNLQDQVSFTSAATADNGHDSPLASLLRSVAATGYRFTTTTPLTHQRVLAHGSPRSDITLRDIFGWNRPFAENAVAPALLLAMERAGVLAAEDNLLRSTVRISTIGNDIFLHSAYPTSHDAAVFLGPDTYRFARFIQQAMAAGEYHGTACASATRLNPLRILDVGCGSGAAGIITARLVHEGDRPLLTMSDINPLALRYSAVNAEVAGIPVVLAAGDALSAVTGDFDLIISNPPFLDDATQRAYRHGGARHGRALSVRIATEALARLTPGGRLLLYTGVAMIDGQDPFLAEILPTLQASRCEWSYAEIDPDIFGEELERPVYAQADRIAAVGLVARRKPQES